ncbi:MAG: DUF11 domain-containing protein [Gammaproteobacteria bacterium]|nr:DUF11 domain-containing protein [Gammaproteobacteria bacterium]
MKVVTFLLTLFAISSSVHAALISRTITIDGDVSDWSGIITNDGQFSTDAEGTVDPTDLDYQVQATGRDLKKFSYTFDSKNLYFYVERFASQSNKNDWWFYLDTNASGRMEDGEYIFNVRWQGSNGEIERILWQYDAIDNVNGDPLTVGSPPRADGYDMPGQNINPVDLDPPNAKIVGGTATGTGMEAFLLWSEIGLGGPTSLNFHVSSSNGQNLPSQIDDNMDGPNGGSLSFTDLSLSKTTNQSFVPSGSTAAYTIVLSNLGPDSASNIVVLDDLGAAGLTYVSDSADGVASTYDANAGQWQVGALAANESISLVVVATATVANNQSFTNFAVISDASAADIDATNNQAQATVTFGPTPVLTVWKTARTVRDPVSVSMNPKAIPGAWIEYTVVVENAGSTPANDVVVTDSIPSGTSLYVRNIEAGIGPVKFVDGINGTATGLIYEFLSLSDGSDSLEFSDSFGADNYAYVPTPDAIGVDRNVTSFRIRPSGSMRGLSAGAASSAGFRVRVVVD